MSLFKFASIQAITFAKNNPRVKCATDVKNGYVFTIDDNGSNYKEEAVAFADAAGAKAGDAYVAMNIIETPELWRLSEHKIAAGEFIRAIKLDDLVGFPVELSSDLVTTAYADVAVGDVVVPSNSTDDAAAPLVWKKAVATGYTVGIEILEKTTFGGTGFYGKIVKN